MKLLKYTILIAALSAAFTVQSAKADFMSTLNVGNSDLSGFPGPYGTVDVSLSGQTATITFTADAGFAFVDSQAANVQVNSTNFTADPTSVSPNPASDPFTGFDSGTVDGFGTFNLRVNYKDASVPESTISFTVTNNDLADLWTGASDVLAFNGSGFDASAHILVLNSGGITGKAAENAAGVPDSGTTAMLLGGALAGLGVMRRYLKR